MLVQTGEAMLNFKRSFFDYISIFAGSLMFSLGIAGFLQPAGISPGGLTGVATVINRVTSLPTGTVLLLINAPLLVLGFLKLGGKPLVKTLFSTVVTSVAIDVFTALLPTFSADKVICALAGGTLMGGGLAAVFLRGGTSGGTDIAAMLLRKRKPYVPIGRLLLVMDAAVIALSAAVYRDLGAALYAVLAITVSSTLIDKLLSGSAGGKLVFIITDKPQEAKREIFALLGRGVSEIPIYGGYTGKQRSMLMCAVRRSQTADFSRMLKERDDLFVVMCDAAEIMGNGFGNVY